MDTTSIEGFSGTMMLQEAKQSEARGYLLDLMCGIYVRVCLWGISL